MNVPERTLSRPPFRVIPGQSAAEAADDIVSTFCAFNAFEDGTRRAFEGVLANIDATRAQPLVDAGRRLAEAIDHGVGAGRNNAYHNAQHFREVLLGSNFLSLLAGIDEIARLEVAVAALMHDLHHDGRGNGPFPFRLERLSVDSSAPYLEHAGVPTPQRRRLAAMVIATEMKQGVAIARSSQGAPRGRVGNGPRIPEVAPELGALFGDPVLARQALILCEADVLPSIGLTVDHAVAMQERLSTEWGVQLDREDKLRFVTKDFPGFKVGTFFQPNVERLVSFLSQPT